MSSYIIRDDSAALIAFGEAHIHTVPIIVSTSEIYVRRTGRNVIVLPEELSAALADSAQDLPRAAFEVLALEAYRVNKLSTTQLRRLLGYRTRAQVHAFLKQHGVYLRFGPADLEHDRQAGDALQLPPSA